jgi:hypothetical protein
LGCLFITGKNHDRISVGLDGLGCRWVVHLEGRVRKEDVGEGSRGKGGGENMAVYAKSLVVTPGFVGLPAAAQDPDVPSGQEKPDRKRDQVPRPGGCADLL